MSLGVIEEDKHVQRRAKANGMSRKKVDISAHRSQIRTDMYHVKLMFAISMLGWPISYILNTWITNIDASVSSAYQYIMIF